MDSRYLIKGVIVYEVPKETQQVFNNTQKVLCSEELDISKGA